MDYLCSLRSVSLPNLCGDPYASADKDETYQPSDETESTDSEDTDGVDSTQ